MMNVSPQEVVAPTEFCWKCETMLEGGEFYTTTLADGATGVICSFDGVLMDEYYEPETF